MSGVAVMFKLDFIKDNNSITGIFCILDYADHIIRIFAGRIMEKGRIMEIMSDQIIRMDQEIKEMGEAVGG